MPTFVTRYYGVAYGYSKGCLLYTSYINHIAHTGNVTICRDHEARDRRDIIVIGKVLNIKRLLQGMQTVSYTHLDLFWR